MKVGCLGLVLVAGLVLTGCDPFEQRNAEIEEKKRIECLDKICPGDIEPSHDRQKEVALKLNGNWYFGPKAYFNNRGQAEFEWWEHKPITREMKRPPEMQQLAVDGKGYDFAVQIFLKGRHGRPIESLANAEKSSWDDQWKKMSASGMEMMRTELTPDLYVVRFKQTDGTPYRMAYFVATKHKVPLGNHAPVAVCEAPTHSMNRCTGDFFVFDGTVHVDFRFNAKHATDWPAIYQEISRILQQIRWI